MAFFDWIVNEWQLLTVPVAVFIFSLIALLWLRRLAINRIVQWQKKSNYPLDTIILRAFQWPSTIWCVIISVSLGIAVSPVSILPATWKSPIVKGLWTLFLLSLVLVILNVIRELITFYSPKLQLSRRNTVLVKNTVSIIILAVFILIALEIWGVPTTPIILLIVIVVLVGAIVFRDTVPNLFAGLQLNTTREIKVGDYIKLGTGEEGYVTKIDWRNTYVKGSDESIAIIPNRHIVQTKLFNYGRPLKKAKEPFYFSSRLTFPELTGLKARNLKELGTVLKSAPDAVIYYHTHHFLEEHFYLTPEPANDFAIWVNDVLGDQALGERLASVDTVAFSSLSALKNMIVSIIDEYITQRSVNREAMEGEEFHFMKSVSVIFPTPYLAHDLREFVEALRKVSLGSLYFHMYESKLRLGRGQNDFSAWMVNSLDEAELAADIARIDPYTYTMEGLRSTLIKSIEKHLK